MNDDARNGCPTHVGDRDELIRPSRLLAIVDVLDLEERCRCLTLDADFDGPTDRDGLAGIADVLAPAGLFDSRGYGFAQLNGLVGGVHAPVRSLDGRSQHP